MPRLDYGPVARTLLQVATSRRWCTQESFAAYLTAQQRGPDAVSRGTVASWESGREHLPGDVLLHLARHTGRAQELMQVLVDELDLVVVERPGASISPGDVIVVAGRASGRLGRLLEHVLGERASESDGGEAVTARELEERLALIGDAEAHLAQLRHDTETALRRARC